MTHERDIEHILDAWFADGPTEAPDRALDAVADRIQRQPQRPAWRLDWRLLPMNPLAKAGAAIAAVAIIAVVAFTLLPGSSGVGGVSPTPTPVATPTPTPTPTPTASPSPTHAAFDCTDSTACSGPLAAGLVASTAFSPPFTFTADDGLVNSLARSNLYELDTGTPDYVMVWSDVAISQHTATCEAVKQPGVGNAVQDWVDFVTHHPGIVSSGLGPVTMGTVKGQVVDLKVRPGWTKSCPNFDFKSVQFIMNADGVSGTYGAAQGEDLRLYVLDVNGETVLIEHYGDRAASDQLVSSIRFSPAP